jgi:hypothetical protein
MTTVYCCECEKDVEAVERSGADIYALREDLAKLVLWQCRGCLNYVGAHKNLRATPLGNIPTPKMRGIRLSIHMILDPIWKDKHMERREVYEAMSQALGYNYHTAHIKTIKEAERVLGAVTILSRRCYEKAE